MFVKSALLRTRVSDQAYKPHLHDPNVNANNNNRH